MDHQLAVKTNSLDKYLLDELSAQERSDFEEHLFDCSECATQLRQDLAMMASIKEVLRETPVSERNREAGWKRWFQPLMLAPSLLAAAFAVVIGYQNIVSIPAMLRPQVLESSRISATTRGQAGQIVAPRGVALFSVAFDVMAHQVFPSYVCEFSNAAGAPVMSLDCAKHTTSEFTLSLLLPLAKFPPGEYTMILRPASDRQTEVGRYRFVMRNEDN